MGRLFSKTKRPTTPSGTANGRTFTTENLKPQFKGSLPSGLNTDPIISFSPDPTSQEKSSRPRRSSDPGTVPSQPWRRCRIIRPPSNESKSVVIRALFDYNSCYDDDLVLAVGERMEILKQDNKDNGWWYAKKLSTGEEGYVPSNYVIMEDNKLESQEWWFGTDRKEAIKRLILPGNPVGTFMIRSCRDKNAYALSMQVSNSKGEPEIRHYKIKKNSDGRCYIGSNTFADLIELVQYYTENRGLQCCLSKPCPKEIQKIPFREFRVKRSEIQLGESLGSGNFGTVYKGVFRNMVDVAVKTLKPGSSVHPDEFMEEAKTMHILRHPHLVQLMGVCAEEDGEPAYIITERMVHGDLLKYIKADKGEKTKFPNILDMAAQVADGMSYLEEKGFVHRDLRAANILVGEKNVVKISDFGLALLLDCYYCDDEYYRMKKAEKFPLKWTAPEAVNRRKFSAKSDVWSFGIFFYELITYGKPPYQGLDNSTALNKVQTGYRMPNPAIKYQVMCPEEVYEVMRRCWNEDPDDRPSFQELKDSLEDLIDKYWID